jgi:hypothetical protein
MRCEVGNAEMILFNHDVLGIPKKQFFLNHQLMAGNHMKYLQFKVTAQEGGWRSC